VGRHRFAKPCSTQPMTSPQSAAELLTHALDEAEGNAINVISAGGDGLLTVEWHTANFLAANDPAHVLKVIAAHREILEMHTPEPGSSDGCPYCQHSIGLYPFPHGGKPCATVRVLATAYGWTP
jgi:hypothetical protein